MKSNFKQEVQTFGRSLLLPIAVLAPIGMIMGIASALTQSYMIDKFPFLGNEILNMIIVSAKDITNIVFSNIPLLFAMGVAYGVSKKEKGIAVFASVLGYLTLLISMNVALKISGNLVTENAAQVGQGVVLGIKTLKLEALGGIIAGLVAAKVTDRFYRLELPVAFAFFSGKKSVPIITFLCILPIGFIIPSVWNVFTSFMMKISFIFMNDYVGPGVYWTLNRGLIPFGLHHVLASILRFTEAGGTYIIDGQTYTGILNAMNQVLFELGPSHEAWGLMPKISAYLGGAHMLTTMFRVPAIALAMYTTSFKQNKKMVKGILITIVLTAMLGNITEPLEFSFLFISPMLYMIYCVLCGLMTIPYSLLSISIGYIRGTIFDFGIFGLLYENTHWLNLILLGIVNFVVFYFVFRFIILKFNLKTPGREDDVVDSTLIKEKRYDEIAEIVVKGLGGKENIKNVENCVTRLRVDLKSQDPVDSELLKTSGTSGLFFPQKNHIHVVFGPHVEFVRNAVDDKLANS